MVRSTPSFSSALLCANATGGPAANRSAILEFEVDDVDGVRARLSDTPVDYVMAPTNQPWGNRSMLLRDPDGNLINIFSRMKRG